MTQFKNVAHKEATDAVLDQGWVRLWLVFTAWASISGWLLSLGQSLTAFGYALSFLLFSLPCFWAWKRMGWSVRSFSSPFKRWRWRKVLPFIFLILLILILAGGAFHPPNNHDFLSYRFSRMLHWWAQSGWLWIDTANSRMNYSGLGFEWTAMPLFSFTESSRLFFLINLIPFALMPGLLFSVFRDVGLSRRVAWYWMWILPGAYCYVMQAGSVANDSYGVFFLLAAIHFFCRAAKPGHFNDFWWGMIAAALLTGVKLSNLPLLLPCFLAAVPAMMQAFRKPVTLVGVSVICVLVSAVPSVIVNAHFAGHWSGDPGNHDRLQIQNPVAGLLGNSLQLGVQSLVPPVLVGGSKITQVLMDHIPVSWMDLLNREFPRFYIGMGELPQEESAGIGLGLCFLLITSIGLLLVKRPSPPRRKNTMAHAGRWIFLGIWGALLFYMMKMGSECTARLLCNYYPLLFASLFSLPGWEMLTRRTWWRFLAGGVLASAIIPLVLTPSRPLLPIQGILNGMGEKMNSPQLERAKQVYEVYGKRDDILAPVREKLPIDARVIGFLGGEDDIEIALWRPFGERFLVSPLKPESYPEWVVFNEEGLKKRGYNSGKDWLAANHYERVAEVPVVTKVRQGSVTWTVAKSEAPGVWYSPLDVRRIPIPAALFLMVFGWGILLARRKFLRNGKSEKI